MKLLSTAAMLSLGLTTLHGQEVQKVPAPKTDAPKLDTPAPHRYVDNWPLQTFYLGHAYEPNDANEILTALRLMLDPADKLWLEPSQKAILVRASPEDMELAQKIIKDMDRLRKAWRLTYTIIELDNGKRIGVQHTAMVVLEGGRTTVKNGSKIPVATGSTDAANGHQQTQFTYLDVGLNIDASLDGLSNGARLRSKVEQSSAIEDKNIAGVQEPIIRQSVTEGTAILTPGKPVTIGSLDIPASTRHLDIEVVMDPIP